MFIGMLVKVMSNVPKGQIEVQRLTCFEEIAAFSATLKTGDILFFTTGLWHSILSFTIEMSCNSEWTHSGMVIRSPATPNTILLWESVNQHRAETGFTDVRTGGPASGNGVRLIDFKIFIESGYGCMKKNRKGTCIFAVLRLNHQWPLNKELQRQIENYVLNQSVHTKMVYPQSMWPLVASWYDGWLSPFVCCGMASTYQVEVMNLSAESLDLPKTHLHYQQRTEGDRWETEEEIFCSQLVVTTLEHTSFFKSAIPCQEWTVEDLTKGSNINHWFQVPKGSIGPIGYVDRIETKTLECGMG
jgi:hypothetical protein